MTEDGVAYDPQERNGLEVHPVVEGVILGSLHALSATTSNAAFSSGLDFELGIVIILPVAIVAGIAAANEDRLTPAQRAEWKRILTCLRAGYTSAHVRENLTQGFLGAVRTAGVWPIELVLAPPLLPDGRIDHLARAAKDGGMVLAGELRDAARMLGEFLAEDVSLRCFGGPASLLRLRPGEQEFGLCQRSPPSRCRWTTSRGCACLPTLGDRRRVPPALLRRHPLPSGGVRGGAANGPVCIPTTPEQRAAAADGRP